MAPPSQAPEVKRLSRQCMSTQMSARKVVPFLLAGERAPLVPVP
jgi:hypothetical protein